MSGAVHLVQLDSCGSTQDEVRRLLAERPAGETIAVAARSQTSGRGRGGRRWQDPPGDALLLSIGQRGMLPLAQLEDLPRRVTDALVHVLEHAHPQARGSLAWKPPNDLVAAADGAKVAGVLVDSRSIGEHVSQVVVGVGVNVSGPAFVTADGRAATSLATVLGADLQRDALLELLLPALAVLFAPHGGPPSQPAIYH